MVARVFPRFRQFDCYLFEFSSALKDIYFLLIGSCDNFGFELRHSIEKRSKQNIQIGQKVSNIADRNILGSDSIPLDDNGVWPSVGLHTVITGQLNKIYLNEIR